MAITRQKKEEVVASVRDHAKKSASIVFANFKRLTVIQQNELRRALRDGMYTGEMPVLDGEVSIAYGADELATAREMLVFVKKYPEQLAFAGGVFGGKYMSKEEIISIASIPGMDALRAQFLQLINSPRQRFAMVVKAKAEK
jgi:large subunit ribosomal protein L10